MAKMKHQAIVGNIGHFDNEIDMAGLAKIPGIVKDEVKPQVHTWTFPDGKVLIVLSEGRLLNLGNATGHPSFVMSNSFADQTLAQIELFTKPEEYPTGVYVLPKHLDEKVARLHLDALGVKLTTLARSRPPTSVSRSRARTSPTTTATDAPAGRRTQPAPPRRRHGCQQAPAPPCRGPAPSAPARPRPEGPPCPAAAIRSTIRTTTPPSAKNTSTAPPAPPAGATSPRLTAPSGDHAGSVDLALDELGRPIRLELHAASWQVRGAALDGVTWVRTDPTGTHATEGNVRAHAFTGTSPAFLVATARLLRLTPGSPATRVRLVAFTDPVLAPRTVDQSWALMNE